MLPKLLACLVVLAAPSLATASTLCVDPAGSGGCFTTIQAAVDAASPGTTIDVAAGTYAENVVVPTPKRVILRAAGSTIIQADPLTGALTAEEGTHVVIDGITLTGAQDGIFALDRTTIAVSDCDISGNARFGIAVSLKARATVTGSTISGNGQIGIGIDGAGRVAVSSSTVSGNNLNGVPFGGGIYSIKSLEIVDSTIRDNHGWGVNGYRSVRITGSTISGNANSGVQQATSLGMSRLSNSTISGNGGGMYVNQHAVLDHVTIAGNTASSSGGGLSVGPQGRVSLQASIIADNVAPSAPDCATKGALRLLVTNLIEDTSGCAFAAVAAPLTADPLLGPLQSNGGTTDTRALGIGSPALDVVTRKSACSAPDQRGVARATPCDLGAYEAS